MRLYTEDEWNQHKHGHLSNGYCSSMAPAPRAPLEKDPKKLILFEASISNVSKIRHWTYPISFYWLVENGFTILWGIIIPNKLGSLGPYRNQSTSLVGGIPTPLKNDGVKVDYSIPFPPRWKIIKFRGSKPPTSSVFWMAHSGLVSSCTLITLSTWFRFHEGHDDSPMTNGLV